MLRLYCFEQNILIKEADGRITAVVADFGLATTIPNPW